MTAEPAATDRDHAPFPFGQPASASAAEAEVAATGAQVGAEAAVMPAGADARDGARMAHGRVFHLLTMTAPLVALAILVASGLLIWHLRQQTLQQSSIELITLDRMLAEQAERVFLGVDLQLLHIAEGLSAGDGVDWALFNDPAFENAMADDLRKKIGDSLELNGIGIMTPAGKLVVSSAMTPAPRIDLSDRDYFQALRDNPRLVNYIGSPVRSKLTGIWTIALARRIAGPDGQFAGVIVAAINLRYFTQFYSDTQHRPGGTIALWRHDGALLARDPPLDEEPGRRLPPARVAEVLPTLDGWVSRTIGLIDPVPQLIASRQLRGFPLTVTVSRTEWAALAQWRRQAPLIGAFGLVAAVAIIGLAWAFVRQLATHELLQQARVQSQRERQARVRFEAASRAKSYFLANMSHELRTPLNAILGFSEILQLGLFGPLVPRYRGYAEDIHRSGTHLLNLVNDILDFSKSEEHRINLERDEVNVADVVEAAVAMLRREAEAAGLLLEAAVEPGLPALLGDEMRLKQVLVNLLSNAIKFTNTGGRIAVRARRRDDWLVLEVSDTGIGIAAADMATVLEPFGQVESTLVRKYPGTGLGLPLSKRIIELLGGNLVITSTVGVGTTVTIEIPLSGGDAAPDPAVDTAADTTTAVT